MKGTAASRPRLRVTRERVLQFGRSRGQLTLSYSEKSSYQIGLHKVSSVTKR